MPKKTTEGKRFPSFILTDERGLHVFVRPKYSSRRSDSYTTITKTITCFHRLPILMVFVFQFSQCVLLKVVLYTLLAWIFWRDAISWHARETLRRWPRTEKSRKLATMCVKGEVAEWRWCGCWVSIACPHRSSFKTSIMRYSMLYVGIVGAVSLYLLACRWQTTQPNHSMRTFTISSCHDGHVEHLNFTVITDK